MNYKMFSFWQEGAALARKIVELDARVNAFVANGGAPALEVLKCSEVSGNDNDEGYVVSKEYCPTGGCALVRHNAPIFNDYRSAYRYSLALTMLGVTRKPGTTCPDCLEYLREIDFLY